MNDMRLFRFRFRLFLIAMATLAIVLLNNRCLLAKVKKHSPEQSISPSGEVICGSTHDRSLLWRSLQTHATTLQQLAQRQSVSKPLGITQIGDIAAILDNGSLILGPGDFPFDLDNRTLSFSPNSLGGYDISTKTLSFDTNYGTNLQAGDDTNHNISFTGGFSFPYGGLIWSDLWIQSNGSVRFGSSGTSGSFSIEDFSAEKAVIAALFTDLNPATSGGVFYRQDTDKFVATWLNVPEFNATNSNTFQLTLFSSGVFEISFNGVDVKLPKNLMPLSVGYITGKRVAAFRAVDFSNTPVSGASGTKVFESFFTRTAIGVDYVGVANAFYTSFPDSFDQLVLLSTFTYPLLGSGAFAFHSPVKNNTQGIGKGVADHSVFYGSGGKLKSFLNLNALEVWPADPAERFLADGYNFLGLLGEETGHRWGSTVSFDSGSGPQNLLLGRSMNHWSRYLDSDASTMEGNDWNPLGGNQFQVAGFVGGYSQLDHYLMGLRTSDEVEPFFYISSTFNNELANRAEGVALPGFSASGTQIWVTVDDIINAEGTRIPGRDNTQKDFRQAFILLSQQGHSPTNAELTKLSNFITAWRPYFHQATDGRATLSTDLSQRLPVAAYKGKVTANTSGLVVSNLTVKVPELGITQRVPQGGYYALRVAAEDASSVSETHVVVTEADSFKTHSESLTFTFGVSATRNVVLEALFAANIQVSNDTIDFGATEVNSSNQKNLIIQNTGNALLNISSFNVNNNVFSASASPLTIASGATDSVLVAFMPNNAGTFTGALTILSNAPDASSLQVTLKGTGTAATPTIALQPSSFTATVVPNDSIKKTLTIANSGGEALNYSLSAMEGANPATWIGFSKVTGNVSGGNEESVVVTFDATGLAGGSFAADILVDSNDPVHAQEKIAVNLTVTASPVFSVNVDTVDFGLSLVGRANTAYVEIENKGAVNLEVSNIMVDAPQISVTPLALTIQPQSSDSVQLVLVAQNRGLFAATLSIATNDPNRFVVSLPIVSTVVSAPAISVTPLSLALSVEEKETAQDTLHIRNSGGSPLDYTIVTGGLVTAAPAAGIVLADATQSVLALINATSLQTGTFRDTVFVISNDATRPQVTVPVTVEVTPPVSVEETQMPSLTFTLAQNYPNPFNPETTISYVLPQAQHVRIVIFDIAGRQIRKLVDSTQESGTQAVHWDGTDETGNLVASGVYLYQIQTGSVIQTHKMLLVK